MQDRSSRLMIGRFPLTPPCTPTKTQVPWRQMRTEVNQAAASPNVCGEKQTRGDFSFSPSFSRRNLYTRDICVTEQHSVYKEVHAEPALQENIVKMKREKCRRGKTFSPLSSRFHSGGEQVCSTIESFLLTLTKMEKKKNQFRQEFRWFVHG